MLFDYIQVKWSIKCLTWKNCSKVYLKKIHYVIKSLTEDSYTQIIQTSDMEINT